MFAALIPLLSCVAAAFVVYLRAEPAPTLRESFLAAVTFAAGWLVLGTELLGLFHAIHFWPVLLWWLGPLLLLVTLLGRAWRRRKFPPWPRLTFFDGALLLAIAFVLGWAWCQAWFSPPNNVDSQEYHLSRQVFWLQQGSVEHYPASNLRQLAMPPLTEFAGLHLMVLTGGDRCHNLVQWFALVFTLCAVSLTTRKFNLSPAAQLLAALWTVTIPLGFMQASTTKNDVVVMMWICWLAYGALLMDTPSRPRWSQVILLGLGFGALILTKGTGLIFGLPIAGLTAFFLFRHHGRRAVPILGLIAAIVLVFNLGHFTRNYRAFGSFAPDQPGIHDGPSVGNADYSPGALASNMLRSAASHFVTPSQALNDRLTAFVRRLHEKLGRNIDDPRTTWLPGGRFRPYQFWQDDEDKAAAPAHMLFVLLLPAALFWVRREVPWKAVVPLLLAFMAGFVLFSLLLKWQNWHVRLIIALPAVLAPVFAWCCCAPRLRYAGPPAALLLLITLLPSLNSLQRPLCGLKSIFHADPLMLRCYFHPNWAAEYRELAARIDREHPQSVGFFTGASSPDYPMQRLLLDRYSPPPVFMVFNATLQVPGKPESDPDILLVARSPLTRLRHASTGTWYAADSHIGRYTLFLKQEAP